MNRRGGRRNLLDVGLGGGFMGFVVLGGLVVVLVGVRGGGVLLVCILVVLVLDVLGGLLIGLLGGLFGGLLVGIHGVGGAVARRLGLWALARSRTVPPLAAPRSLRWVRGVLPDGEGAAWLAEVVSCLAETLDKDKRRRYVRSYRRSVPRLVGTSWAEHLRASRRRKLS
ncbi:MAG: hypothetical protein JO309_09590 [Pseudonocardiales bacterium]|nr:hypothetical protein [Pseudonocardiales bacterium]MBV9729638.1 hypothetical protein [Pseudonocardiales bacterium]